MTRSVARGLKAFVVILIAIGSIAVAEGAPADFQRFDQLLAKAIGTPGRSVVGLDPGPDIAEAGDDIALANRRLLVQALAILEPVREDVARMSSDQADILLSILQTVASSAAYERRLGIRNDLDAVGEAVWSSYVAPLLDDARSFGLIGLADHQLDERIAKRWYDPAAGKVTVAELYAVPDQRTLRWAFADTLGRADKSLTRDDGGAKRRPALVLLVDLSDFTGDRAATLQQLQAEGGARLAVRASDEQAPVRHCLAEARSSIIELPVAKPAPPGRTTKADAAPRPAPPTPAECRKLAPAPGAATGRAILIDTKRRLVIFDRPAAGEVDVERAARLARSLAKDWP